MACEGPHPVTPGKVCGAENRVMVKWGEPPLQLCTTCYLEMIKGHSMVPYNKPYKPRYKERTETMAQKRKGERLFQQALSAKKR